MTSATQTASIPIPSSEAREAALGFENVDFFSDYFLRHGLWSTPDLIAKLNMAGADEAWHTLHRAYNTGTFGLDEFANPEETYSRWIRPLLRALGYESGKGAEIETERGLLAVSHTHTFGPAPVAGEADTRPRVLFQTEAWGTDLDAARDGKTGRTTPTSQAFSCLRHADSRARWALVTNGQEIRLIGSDLSLPPRAHLTFDLNRIFHRGNNRDASYLLFWALTNEKATQPGEDRKCLLDSILEESRRLAQSVRGALGDVIPQLLETLVRDLRRNNPEFREKAEADEAHRTGVILLYRLLFIAYAEAKGLLPISNQLYRDAYSFETLRTRVEDKARRNEPWPPGRRTLWPQLTALFRFLSEDLSTPDLPLMPLGGRLFDPGATPWLASATLPDSDTARLIEGLSLAEVKRGRSRRAQSRERINYADLDISELGSIYEALLEYKPTIARETMVVVETQRGDQTLPERLAGAHSRKPGLDGQLLTIVQGEFYLATWNGLRKGSGSYYTPRALTEFQVRNALEPLTRAHIENGEPEKILYLKICDPAMGSAAFLVAAIHDLAERLEAACIQASLDKNYLRARERILESSLGERVARVLIDVVDRAHIAHLDEEDRASLGRLAAEHSIYGVDLNPMAVELARVSVWLATLAKDRPLTFLDDRLACGNSLIGARLGDLDPRKIPEPIISAATADLRGSKRTSAEKVLRDSKQRTLSVSSGALKAAIETLSRERTAIAAVPTGTVAEARWKAQAFESIRESPDSPFGRLEALADLWAASWFWSDPSLAAERREVSMPTPDDWQIIARHQIDGHEEIGERQLAVIESARRIGRARRYFAWELAFPEVFQDRDGFDVVIGNPPWEATRVAHKEWYLQYAPEVNEFTGTQFDEWHSTFVKEHPDIAEEERIFFDAQDVFKEFLSNTSQYPISAGRDVNTYKFFLQRMLDILKPNGVGAQILPSTLGTGEDSAGLRKKLLETSEIAYWIDFENAEQIFPIHRQFRFVLLATTKGTPTRILRARFYEHDVEALRKFPQSGLLELPLKLIQQLSGENLAFTEFRSQQDIDPLVQMYSAGPQLSVVDEGLPWNILYRQEFNTTLQRALFNTDGQGLPLLKGESFYLLDPGVYGHDYWVKPDRAMLFLREKLRESKDRAFIEASLGGSIEDVLPPDRPRVVVRNIASSTNSRTTICARVSSGVFLAHSVAQLFVAPRSARAEFYLVGMMGSVPVDYAMRLRVQTNISWNFIKTVPVPRPTQVDFQDGRPAGEVARLAARLQGAWVGLRPDSPDSAHRSPPAGISVVSALLNAYSALLFELSGEQFRHMISQFPLLDSVESGASLAALELLRRGESSDSAEKVLWREFGDSNSPPWKVHPWVAIE